MFPTNTAASADARPVLAYTTGAMVLHWLIALLIVAQASGGFLLARTEMLPGSIRFPAIQWHKTIGLCVLALTLARIGWRLLNPPPAGAPMRRVEARLAGLVHFLFYALMLAVPLAGWFAVSASPRAIPTFLFLSPVLPFVHLGVPASGEAAGLAMQVHTLLAYSFVALLSLHVAGAAKHSVADRAPSFRRILPVGRLRRAKAARVSVPLAVVLAAGFLAGGVFLGREAEMPAAIASTPVPAVDAPSAADAWTIDPSASKLGFAATFSSKPIEGTIGRFDSAIRFDPTDLSSASAAIAVDPTSITVGDPFVQSNVAGADGFDAAQFATVSLRLDRFERTDAGFIGRGTLTVKNHAVPVVVPFTFNQDNGVARVAGEATVDRTALGLGLGNDPTGQFLSKTIAVSFTLQAHRPDASGT